MDLPRVGNPRARSGARAHCHWDPTRRPHQYLGAQHSRVGRSRPRGALRRRRARTHQHALQEPRGVTCAQCVSGSTRVHGLWLLGHRLRCDAARRQRISAFNAKICRHESFWVRRLQELNPISLPYRETPAVESESGYASRDFDIPESVRGWMRSPAGQAWLQGGFLSL